MAGDVVGILNVPGKSGVSLLYQGDGVFSVDIPGTPTLGMDEIKSADSRGLIAWSRTHFLEELERPAAGHLPVAENPLQGVNFDALGEDSPEPPVNGAESSDAGGQPAEEGLSGIQSGTPPLADRVGGKLGRLFGGGQNAENVQKAFFGILLGFLVLAILGFLIWTALSAIRNTTTGAVTTTTAAAPAGSKPLSSTETKTASKGLDAVQSAITGKDEKAYASLVGIDAIAGRLASAYASAAQKAQRLSDSETASLRRSYASILKHREAGAVASGNVSESIFDGQFAGAVRVPDGTVTISVSGGNVAFVRNFTAIPSKAGYRFTDLSNASDLVAWMVR